MGCRKLANLFYLATIVRWFRSGVSAETHRPEAGDIVANRPVVRAASPSYRSLHDVADLQQQQYVVWRVMGILIVRHFCRSGFQRGRGLAGSKG